MVNATTLTIIISVIGVILIPTLALMLRGAVKWTRTEDRLATVVDTLQAVLTDNEKVHHAMYEQMRTDRDATDRRLRFIEEWFMRRGDANVRQQR